MTRSKISARKGAAGVAIAAALAGLLTLPAPAQLREQLKNKVVDDVANGLVSQIQGDSCAQFSAMLKKSKSGSSSSSKASEMMKNDHAARARFVDKVAGPLVNKMIDCDLLPGH